VWLVLTSLTQAAVLRHAVIVGANEGGAALEPLRYAELDAQHVADTLTELGGFDPAHVDVLYSPTAKELEDALHAHATIAGSFDEDMFLFYYSGHADARGLRLGSDIYPYDTLRADIRAMPAEVKLGVLDACRSGTITRLKGAALSAPFLVEDRLAAEGEAWMTASSADESAQESDTLRGSFFTHFLLAGLVGAADKGQDEQVSLHEAYQYAHDRVVDETGATEAGPQHPMFDYRLSGESDVELTDLARGRATVILPEDLEGEVAVTRMPDRTPITEVAKKAGMTTTLALTPGTYRFRLVNGKDLRETMILVSDGSRVVASQWGSALAEAGTPKGAFARDAIELARASSREGVSWASHALDREDLRHSPMIAGGASLLVPGAGQFYNGQWVKGGLLFAGTFAFLGGSLFSNEDHFFRGSITGPDGARLAAAMLYGAAIADAAYQPHREEKFRPMGGFTLSTSAEWGSEFGPSTPYIAGINAEWLAAPNLSMALDRVGWTRTPDGRSVWNVGSRFELSFLEGKRWRPGAFVGIALRVHDDADPLAPTTDSTYVRVVAGGGMNLRWYVTPRYFVEGDFRVETEGGAPILLGGGGLGVHFGH
jgi:hypothetical protein